MKRLISILLISIFFCGICPVATADGGAFLVMDGRTKIVLESKNGDTRLPMASTTKVMTALVVLNAVKLSERVTISSEAAGIEGSSLYIKAGETYTVEELLYGLMLRSANDCAVALAVYVGKTEAAFVEMMNRTATEMGLQNTHFANPNGLPAEEHYTTAHELAIIMVEAMKNKEFQKITGSKQYKIREQVIVNHNKLLTLYGSCIGGKTGYTMSAGRCLVTMAEKDGVPLVCVTLGRREDWNIHTSAYEKWYNAMETVVLAEAGTFAVDLRIAGGGLARVSNCHKVEATLPSYDGTVEIRTVAPTFVYPNKEVGYVVGTVEYWYHDAKIGESPLVLEQEIQVEMKKELFLSRIFQFFRRLFLKKC